MTGAADLVLALRARGAVVSVTRERKLACDAPAGVLDDHDMKILAAHRDEVILYIEREQGWRYHACPGCGGIATALLVCDPNSVCAGCKPPTYDNGR